jgi:hypothetical protein
MLHQNNKLTTSSFAKDGQWTNHSKFGSKERFGVIVGM